MNTAMVLERQSHINAQPHERSQDRDGYANGFKPRGFQTALGKLQLSVPQVRDCSEPFRSLLPEKGSRIDQSLKTAIAEMYFQGVSTRRVTKVMEELCGYEVTSTQVSRLAANLDEEFHKWRTRPLPEIAYLILDATYIKVRIDGSVRSVFNAADKVAADQRLEQIVELYSQKAPELSKWMEKNIPEGLTVFSQPENYRKRLRTSNSMENLNNQIKRRTRVVGLFPNTASVLRLTTSILMDQSEEWETGRAYLKPETH